MLEKMARVTGRKQSWLLLAFACICIADALLLRSQSAPNPNPPQAPISPDQLQRQMEYQGHLNTQNYIQGRLQAELHQSILYYGLKPAAGSDHAWTSKIYMPRLTDSLRSLQGIERASMLHESADDKIAQAINHSELARLFLHQDDPETALLHVEAAEPLAAATGDHDLQVDILRIKAAVSIASGKFEEAINIYEDVLNHPEAQISDTSKAEVYLSLGWAFQSLGKVADAMAAYKESQQLFETLHNEDGQTRALIGAGSLSASIGDFSKAIEQYNRAVATAASRDQLVRILVSYAEVLQAQNADWKAVTAYTKAWSLISKQNDKTLQAAILAGLARCLMDIGRYDEARANFEKAEAQMKDAGDRRGEAAVIASLAGLDYWANPDSLRKSDPSKAVSDYKRALELMRQEGDRSGEVGILTELGQVFESQGKWQKAMDTYNEALCRLEDLRTSARLEEFRIAEAGQSEELYRHVVALAVNMHHMEKAFDLSERARARVFLDQLGNARISPRQNFEAREEDLRTKNILLERQIQLELAKPISEVNSERMQSLRTQLSLARTKYEDWIAELKSANPEYASFASISPLTLREAQQTLKPGMTLVSYFILPDVTLAFVVTRDHFHATTLPVSENELELSVHALLDFAGDSKISPAATSLYNALVAPLKSELKNSTLVIVPYGILHDLPFAALTPNGKDYLSDSYTLTVLPNVSAWPLLQSRAKPATRSALVLASDDVVGLPRLRSGREEAEAIASLFGSKPLFGDTATVSMLREHGGEYSILHLMAHVDRDGDNPDASRIILGQGNDAIGYLNMHEILGLDLRSTELVILSGCQSQKGERTRSDDVIALGRAFMYAGAPSVIASLWDVDDEATRQLMVAFYSHLIQGLSKAEALQAAQRDVRRSFPNPYYWASFELLGDPGPLLYSTPSPASQPRP